MKSGAPRGFVQEVSLPGFVKKGLSQGFVQGGFLRGFVLKCHNISVQGPHNSCARSTANLETKEIFTKILGCGVAGTQEISQKSLGVVWQSHKKYHSNPWGWCTRTTRNITKILGGGVAEPQEISIKSLGVVWQKHKKYH